MKIIKLFEELLNEVLTDKVYYFRGYIGAKSMLIDNILRFRPSFFGSQEKSNNFKLFFVSLSRTGSFDTGYAVRPTSIINVRFTLDGRKLNHRFKSSPFDYWKGTNKPRHEYEDRLFHTSAVFHGIVNYITAVDIVLSTSDKYPYTLGNNLGKDIVDIIGACRKHNIPLGIYKNKKDLYKGVNNIMDNLSDYNLSNYNVESDYKEPIDFNAFFAVYFYDDIFLYHRKKITDLETMVKSFIAENKIDISGYSNYKNGLAIEDIVEDMQNIKDGFHTKLSFWTNHESKYGYKDPTYPVLVNLMARKLRKHKIQTLNDYLDYLTKNTKD